LSAELTKSHSFRLFFGDFAYWEVILLFIDAKVVDIEPLPVGTFTSITTSDQVNIYDKGYGILNRAVLTHNATIESVNAHFQHNAIFKVSCFLKIV